MSKSELEETFALHLKACKMPKPQQEHRFHSRRMWRFDFAWPDAKIAVEIEGGVWTRGRHTRGQGFMDDCEKYNMASFLGWSVFRIPGPWIEDGRDLDWLDRIKVLLTGG